MTPLGIHTHAEHRTLHYALWRYIGAQERAVETYDDRQRNPTTTGDIASHRAAVQAFQEASRARELLTRLDQLPQQDPLS